MGNSHAFSLTELPIYSISWTDLRLSDVCVMSKLESRLRVNRLLSKGGGMQVSKLVVFVLAAIVASSCVPASEVDKRVQEAKDGGYKAGFVAANSQFQASYDAARAAGYREANIDARKSYEAGYRRAHPGRPTKELYELDWLFRLVAVAGALQIAGAITLLCFGLVRHSEGEGARLGKTLAGLLGATTGFLFTHFKGVGDVIPNLLLSSPHSDLTTAAIIVVVAAITYGLIDVGRALIRNFHMDQLEAICIILISFGGAVLVSLIVRIIFSSPTIQDYNISAFTMGSLLGSVIYLIFWLISMDRNTTNSAKA